MKAQRLTSADDVREILTSRACGARVEMIQGGPALVRGAVSVKDVEGTEHDATRPVVAVCTCGLTQRGPWCDATHKVARS